MKTSYESHTPGDATLHSTINDHVKNPADDDMDKAKAEVN